MWHILSRRSWMKCYASGTCWKHTFGRPRCTLKDNIKMDIKEIGCKVLDWVYWSHDMDTWLAVSYKITKFHFLKLREVPFPVEELLTSQDGHWITFTDYVPTAEWARIVSIRETNSSILYISVLSFVTMEAGITVERKRSSETQDRILKGKFQPAESNQRTAAVLEHI
jgi:hypothetical protein